MVTNKEQTQRGRSEARNVFHLSFVLEIQELAAAVPRAAGLRESGFGKRNWLNLGIFFLINFFCWYQKRFPPPLNPLPEKFAKVYAPRTFLPQLASSAYFTGQDTRHWPAHCIKKLQSRAAPAPPGTARGVA